ncbi:MAG TPA: RagB/SusD family nutrient uptake outer membrane protein [Cyclobacteriaceae bacterium]
MKSTYRIIATMLLTIFVTTSCQDFLDQNPVSEGTDQTTWKTEADANASVAACYSLIRSAFNASITYYAYGDLTSGEFNSVQGGDGAYSDVMNYNWGIGIPAANIWDPRLKLRLYTNFYTAIMQSNRCLYYIDKMPLSVFTGDGDTEKQATKNRYLGEAYFTRAFNYFYISRVWGDVPLVTSYNDSIATTQFARTAQSEVLDLAISDVKQAIIFLDKKDDASADKVVRADKGSANALLAHIYAWRGEYDKCNDACDAVINSGSYSYIDSTNYTDIYKGQSVEGIFEITQSSQTESMSATQGITSVTLVPPHINNGASQPFWQLDGGLIDYLYSDQTDIRYTSCFEKITNGGGEVYECIKYANIQNINNSNAFQIALNNIPVFRYAGIKLLKAEALASKAGPDYTGALSLVNEVRKVRGAKPFSSLDTYDLLYAISDEQGRELFLEGHRRFDLIRFERVIGEQQISYVSPEEFTAGKYYWPVDPILFSTNYKLTQTPYWVGKMK